MKDVPLGPLAFWVHSGSILRSLRDDNDRDKDSNCCGEYVP